MDRRRRRRRRRRRCSVLLAVTPLDKVIIQKNIVVKSEIE